MDDIYAIIPVSKFKNAKTRLSPFLTEEERENLLKAMLHDVTDTLKKYVDKIFIISRDEDVLSYALFPQVALDFFKYREAQRDKVDLSIADTKNNSYPV